MNHSDSSVHSSGTPAHRKAVAEDMVLPRQFGRYMLQQRLGGGGMGTVYRAYDGSLDIDVALKIPHAHLIQEKDACERFTIEARAAARLRHPYLCAVLDVGQVAGTNYLTMHYIRGKPLSQWHAPNLRTAVALVRKLAQGMAAAHRAGVVHRDLKPANILVTEQEEPVITDFGLALLLESATTRLSHHGDALGTPQFMAPEQIEGDLAAIGPSCDVYGLGVILFHLLTGRYPFSDTNLWVLFQRVLHEPTPSPSVHQAGLDPRLDKLCLRALAKRCEDRFASMDEFAAALADFLGELAPTVCQENEPLPPARRPLVPPETLRFAFAGYGEGAPPQAGFKDRLYLDVGNGLRPGVLDHHQLSGKTGSTASLVLAHPELVDASILPTRSADAPFLMILHEHPDLDGVAAAFLASSYLSSYAFPPAAEALAHYIDRIDEGALGMTFSQPFSLYAAYMQKANQLAQQSWNSNHERWQACVRAGQEIIAHVLDQVAQQGTPLPAVDAFDCPGQFTDQDRAAVKADILRYVRKLEDPRAHTRQVRLRLPSQFGGWAAVEGLLVRDVQNADDPERCQFFKDWARTDSIRCPNGQGFVALSVFHSEGPRQPRRCILSVTPGSGASLRGLGELLDLAESERRRQVFGKDDRISDPTTGAARPTRLGYTNADPWYDGRSHGYTIVDSPRTGTMLTAEEIEGALLKFGAS